MTNEENDYRVITPNEMGLHILYYWKIPIPRINGHVYFGMAMFFGSSPIYGDQGRVYPWGGKILLKDPDGIARSYDCAYNSKTAFLDSIANYRASLTSYMRIRCADVINTKVLI